MVRSFVGKAVPTTEIAIVTNVDTKRLDFVRFHGIAFDFFFKKKTLLFQAFHVGKNFLDLFVRDIGDIDGLSFFLGFKVVRRGRVTFVQAPAASAR